MGSAKETIVEKQLSSWRLLDQFRQRLAKVREKMPPPSDPTRDNLGGPQRLLLEENYFSLMLFELFNPVLDSMRGLCAVSHLKRVKRGDVEVVGSRIRSLWVLVHLNEADMGGIS